MHHGGCSTGRPRISTARISAHRPPRRSGAALARRLPPCRVPTGLDAGATTTPGVPQGRPVTSGTTVPRGAPAALHKKAKGVFVTVAPGPPHAARGARNAETPIERKPSWIRTTAKMGPEYTALHSMVKREGLHTVCQEAGCPNIFECWEDREATFLIGGDICAALRLLRHRHRPPAPSTATSRDGWPSRSPRWTCATPP